MATAERPPPQPVYILRGHSSQVHALHFYQHNLRLLTGDADGWVIMWDMALRRPIAVWRAHEKSILTLRHWGDDKIITHGRDDNLRVWHIPTTSESSLSKALPAEGYDLDRQSPWLLHSILVNTMNFCSLATSPVPASYPSDQSTTDSILFAVPGTQDGNVHIHELPSEKCIHIVPASSAIPRSLVMAIKLLIIDNALALVVGNEAGATSVQIYSAGDKSWKTIYAAQAHAQPILSLDIAPSQGRYFTSSADALIASHPLPKSTRESLSKDDMVTSQTGHAGQQSLSLRDDGRIFATAGWDSRMRIYSAKSLKEFAVLKWHKEGCYAVSFASVDAMALSQPQSSSVLERAEVETSGELVSTVNRETTLTVQQRREHKTKQTHWLAAGSKDGKVSLWDIF